MMEQDNKALGKIGSLAMHIGRGEISQRGRSQGFGNLGVIYASLGTTENHAISFDKALAIHEVSGCHSLLQNELTYLCVLCCILCLVSSLG